MTLSKVSNNHFLVSFSEISLSVTIFKLQEKIFLGGAHSKNFLKQFFWLMDACLAGIWSSESTARNSSGPNYNHSKTFFFLREREREISRTDQIPTSVVCGSIRNAPSVRLKALITPEAEIKRVLAVVNFHEVFFTVA